MLQKPATKGNKQQAQLKDHQHKENPIDPKACPQ
jgi:hypothetical protein